MNVFDKLLIIILVLLTSAWVLRWFYEGPLKTAAQQISAFWQRSRVFTRVCACSGFLMLLIFAAEKPPQEPEPVVQRAVITRSGDTDGGLRVIPPTGMDSGSVPELTAAQAAAGFCVVSVETNVISSLWSISDLPSGTPVYIEPSWQATGRFNDGFWVNTNDLWSFCFNGAEVESVFVSTSGTISFDVPRGSEKASAIPDGISMLAPLWGPLGIVAGVDGSSVWAAPTTNHSLLVTWENVLIDRINTSTNSADIQCELLWNGDFCFRYRVNTALVISNHLVCAQNGYYREEVGLGSATNAASSVEAFEIFWRGFKPYTMDPGGDTDGDGIPDNVEVYVMGTSPVLADSDGDGLDDQVDASPLNPDADGDGLIDSIDMQPGFWNDRSAINTNDGFTAGYHVDNGFPPEFDFLLDTDGDGVADWKEIIAGTATNNAYSVPAYGALFDVTITLAYDLPAPVILRIGGRVLALHKAGAWSVKLLHGVAHEVSLFASQPCHLNLTLLLSSDRAVFLDPAAVFNGGMRLAGRQPTPCGIIALPKLEIQPAHICFHAAHPKTVQLEVTPALPGTYQWYWPSVNNMPTHFGETVNIGWVGEGYWNNLYVRFKPDAALECSLAEKYLYRCIYADDPESEDDNIEPHGDIWCAVHQQEYWRCAIEYPGQPECDHASSGAQSLASRGRPLSVNNDDDDGDGELDNADGDGVTGGDDDYLKVYPVTPYTGNCCSCPEHNPDPSITATRSACSFRLATWSDSSSRITKTSATPGQAVYVEGLFPSPAVGGDQIIWSWTEDGELRARTNRYTIFSLRLFGDYNLDGAINSNDYAAASNLPGYGWGLPVESNTLHKVELKSDVLIPGYKILSLSGGANIRVWTTANPTANDTPLLVTGQTVTNDFNGANFGAYPTSMLYVEALDSGVATLTYSYVGTGDAAGYTCSTVLGMTAVKVELCSVVLDEDGKPYVNNGELVIGDPIGFADVRCTTYVPMNKRGQPVTESFAESENNIILFETDGSNAVLQISRSGMENFADWSLSYSNTVQGVDHYHWLNVGSFVHVAFSNNMQNCTSTVEIVIMDEPFTGENYPVTNAVQIFSHSGLSGYHSNYSIAEPREESGLPAYSAHNAFVVRMEPFGTAAENLTATIDTGDESLDIPFSTHSNGSYVSALIVPVSYEDGEVDLGYESTISVKKLKIKKDKLDGWERFNIDIKSLGASANKITSGRITIGNAMLITGVVSSEQYAQLRATQAVVETGVSASSRLKYGVTPVFTPTKDQIVEQLPKHCVWIHSGHGGNNAGIRIVKKVGSRYQFDYLTSGDVANLDLSYDLVFMNTCESTDVLSVPVINMLVNPPMPMSWSNMTVTSTAVMDIGTALNAKNYIGWDTWVQRELSVKIPKLLMEQLDTTDGESKTIKEAVDDLKDKLERDKPKYYWFGPRLNHKVRDDSVIMDLNKKLF